MIERDLSTVPLQSVRRNTKGRGLEGDRTARKPATLRLKLNMLPAWRKTQAEYKHVYFVVILLGPAEV
jgi:hypothetical protein